MSQQEHQPIAQSAAEWLLLLDAAGADSAELRCAFETWQEGDPRHREAVLQMQPLLDQMRQWREAPAAERQSAKAALTPVRKRSVARRAAQGTVLTLTMFMAAAGWWCGQGLPPEALLADVSTAAGEMRDKALPDGTRMLLGSASAISFDTTLQRRALRLHTGDVLVDVAPDAQRPFEVITREGTIAALGTRFLVRQREGSTELVMLESRTRVTPLRSDRALEVLAGQQVRLKPDAVEAMAQVDVIDTQTSFERLRLVARDQPLPDVLAEIARYRTGTVSIDNEGLADIHFSGVLPLDDTDKALQLLVTSFPQLRVRTVTPWLVRIDTHAEQTARPK
jgi:transmembrane sensor